MTKSGKVYFFSHIYFFQYKIMFFLAIFLDLNLTLPHISVGKFNDSTPFQPLCLLLPDNIGVISVHDDIHFI